MSGKIDKGMEDDGSGEVARRTEDIDTDKVIVRDDTRVIFESIELAPGGRAEIVLNPDRPLRRPVLFMSNESKDRQVIVEQIIHGHVAVLSEKEGVPVDDFRRGQPLDLTVTENEGIKILVSNGGVTKTMVGASLVVGGQKIDTTYRLKGDGTKE